MLTIVFAFAKIFECLTLVLFYDSILSSKLRSAWRCDVLERIDTFLLDITTKVAKRWNWLTGQDNFDLARSTNRAWSVAYVLIVRYALQLSPFSSDILLVVMASMVWCFITENTIQRTEDLRTSEQVRRAKDLVMDLGHRFARVLLLGTTVAIVFLWNIERFLNVKNSWSLFVWPFLIISTVITYIMSIDKPPFSRSQVFDWMRSLFYAPRLAPILAQPSR